MNDTRRNFEPLSLEESLPQERKRLDFLKKNVDKETKKRVENVLNQTYRFDLASFEADVVRSERKAFEDKIEQEVKESLGDNEEYKDPTVRAPGAEKFWEKELVDLNPLDFFKNTKEIILDGERKLRFEDQGVGLYVVLETPTLSIKPEELLYATVNADELSTKELRMSIREFLYLLEDPKGATLVQKAREEGYELPNDLVYDLKNQFLTKEKEKEVKIKPVSKKKAA